MNALKSSLVAGAVLAVAIPSAKALANELTASVGFTTDYTFRGISQNFRNPALQGGFDYAHESGLFAGTWASNVSGNQYTNASLEWDVYGGYNGRVNEDLGYSIALTSVFYPGGKTAAAAPNKKWDTTELSAGVTFKGLNVKYSYALTDWYGIASAANGGFEPTMWATGATTADAAGANLNSKGSGYLEVNYGHTFGEDVTLSLHAGRQTIRNFRLLSYTDYKVGVSKPFGGIAFALNYTATNATDNTLYHVAANGEDKNLRGGILALSVGKTF